VSGDQTVCRRRRRKIVANVDWRIVGLHCSSLMKDAGYTPPRYLVEGFPTPEQLEAVRTAQRPRSSGGRV
jgi:hypothetical protein